MNPKLYTALRWGALCGGILGVLEAASYWALVRAPLQDMLTPVALGLRWFDWLFLIQSGLEWGAALLAGWLAGRELRERNFGLVAGLTSGLIVSILSIIYQMVAPPPLELISDPNGSVDVIGGYVSITLTSLWTGGLGGWIGGWAATRGQTPPS